VEWSAIERCRYDYQIERIHLEHNQILHLFGEFSPATKTARESKIDQFIREKFPNLLGASSEIKNARLGFDIAASGQGDLAVIYMDEAKGDDLWLRGLFSCRTED